MDPTTQSGQRRGLDARAGDNVFGFCVVGFFLHHKLLLKARRVPLPLLPIPPLMQRLLQADAAVDNGLRVKEEHLAKYLWHVRAPRSTSKAIVARSERWARRQLSGSIPGAVKTYHADHWPLGEGPVGGAAVEGLVVEDEHGTCHVPHQAKEESMPHLSLSPGEGGCYIQSGFVPAVEPSMIECSWQRQPW